MRFVLWANRVFEKIVERTITFIRRVTGGVRERAPTWTKFRGFAISAFSTPAFATSFANRASPLGAAMMVHRFRPDGVTQNEVFKKTKGRVMPHRRGRRSTLVRAI